MNPRIPSGTPSSTGTRPGHKFSLELLQDWPQRQTQSGGFAKLGVPLLGVLITRTILFGESILGSSCLEKVQPAESAGFQDFGF